AGCLDLGHVPLPAPFRGEKRTTLTVQVYASRKGESTNRGDPNPTCGQLTAQVVGVAEDDALPAAGDGPGHVGGQVVDEQALVRPGTRPALAVLEKGGFRLAGTHFE